MRRNAYLFTIMLLTMIFCFTTASMALDQSIKLTLADTTGPTGLRGEGVKIFLEEIEKYTDGKVEVEVYWGESLLKAAEIFGGTRDGVVDMGYINPNYTPQRLFVNGSFAIHPRGPIKFSNLYEATLKCHEEVPELEQELLDANQKILYINACLPMTVTSTKPFTSFEDFAGKRVRASSRWYLAQLAGTGATPVSVPWGDCYMALQTGNIDAVYTNLDGIHRTKLDEVAPNVFTMREIWVAMPYYYTINLDTWNSLPENVQSQLVEAGRSASLRYSDLYDGEWERIVNEQKELGYTVTHASPEDIEKWMSMPVIDQIKEDWIKEANEQGIENAEQIVNTMDRIISEAVEKESN